jgi:2-polyprenyl-3-methyl-5-hydroxy-6-metoxy-1,4-benzoquinol methylase
MQDDYKKAIYNNYYNYHTKRLYGNVTQDSIKKHFPVLKYYFSEFLPRDKTASILDAGCGNGNFVFWLTESGHSNVIGIDISKEMIELGKSIDIKNIFQADLFEHLQKNKNAYDVIFCRDVLEHLTKPEVFEMLKLFYDSLKPHGKIVLQVPIGNSPNYSKIFYSDFTHETLFTEAALSQLSRATGYKSIYVKEIKPVPNGIKSGLRYILWILLKQWYKFIQLVETGNAKGFYSQNIIACILK